MRLRIWQLLNWATRLPSFEQHPSVFDTESKRQPRWQTSAVSVYWPSVLRCGLSVRWNLTLITLLHAIRSFFQKVSLQSKCNPRCFTALIWRDGVCAHSHLDFGRNSLPGEQLNLRISSTRLGPCSSIYVLTIYLCINSWSNLFCVFTTSHVTK